MLQFTRKQSKYVLDDMREKIESGERFTVQRIIEDYTNINSPFDHLLAKQKAKGWIQALKIYYRQEKNTTFKCLNDIQEYGLAETGGEFRYINTIAYKLVKGITHNANQSMVEAAKKGLIEPPIQELVRVLKAPKNGLANGKSTGKIAKEPRNVRPQTRKRSN
jgi:hypothetical protein